MLTTNQWLTSDIDRACKDCFAAISTILELNKTAVTNQQKAYVSILLQEVHSQINNASLAFSTSNKASKNLQVQANELLAVYKKSGIASDK